MGLLFLFSDRERGIFLEREIWEEEVVWRSESRAKESGCGVILLAVMSGLFSWGDFNWNSVFLHSFLSPGLRCRGALWDWLWVSLVWFIGVVSVMLIYLRIFFLDVSLEVSRSASGELSLEEISRLFFSFFVFTADGRWEESGEIFTIGEASGFFFLVREEGAGIENSRRGAHLQKTPHEFLSCFFFFVGGG